MLKIKTVDKKSYGKKQLGLEPGDAIISFDGYKTQDLLDYVYYDAKECFTMEVFTKDGETVTVDVDKYEDESLGLTFVDDGLKIKTCLNDCIFCFVRQMPAGMRPSLYVKDDDYRQSLLYGNFVTLTNVTDEELERIVRLQFSPLYVSVQTMNGELRKKMLNNRFADKINYQLKRLEKGKIAVNAQVVLVKGVNDGKELDYTIDELYKLKNIVSAAVVPCGITRFREGLYPIEDIDKEYARSVIAQVESANKRHGGSLIQLADEFFFKADLPLPPAEYYGDFVQVENGVGMSVKFLQTVQNIIDSGKQLLKSGKYLTVCGTSVYKFMLKVLSSFEKAWEGVDISLLPVENKFFGSTVNCTGLLVGNDILNAVKLCGISYDTLLIPNNCLMMGEDKFLDDMTLSELSEKLGKPVLRWVISED